jgi:hypothetical protein
MVLLFCRLSFQCLSHSYDSQQSLIFKTSRSSIFPYVAQASGVTPKNSLSNQSSLGFATMFSSKRFMVLALRFRSLILFELVIVYRMK